MASRSVRWAVFPYGSDTYAYDRATLRTLWSRLHAGDVEPWPRSVKVQAAWALFHAGEFRRAVDAGLDAGGAGITVANKAQCIYANYLERSERTRLALLLEAAGRAEAQQRAEPDNPNAHYWQAYALGRYAQGISVADALEQGLGERVKAALETTIRLAPRHADAHVALGSFHAEVIDKVGRLLGLAQGADAAAGLRLFRHGLELNPASAIARIECANGLVMLEGEARMREAEALYHEAAASTPLDATERLDVELAKSELEDDE